MTTNSKCELAVGNLEAKPDHRAPVVRTARIDVQKWQYLLPRAALPISHAQRRGCKLAPSANIPSGERTAHCLMAKNQQQRRGYDTGQNAEERNDEVTRRYLEAVVLANQQRKLVFQEVLSKPGAENLSLAEQEFFELCIEESDDVFRPGFIVKQTRAQWSEIDGQVMWEAPEWERWPTLNKAKEKCEEWRKALATKGFSQSDMDW